MLYKEKAFLMLLPIYFDEDIVMLKCDFNWDKIAKRLNDMTLQKNLKVIRMQRYILTSNY